MQTQTTTETKPRDFDSEIGKERAQLEKLEGLAQDAEAEAARWQTAFTREPPPESHTNAAIYGQRANNARAAAQAYDRETVQPLLKQQRQAERDGITRVLEQEQTAAERTFARAVTLIHDGARLLDTGIAELTTVHEHRLEAQRQGAIVPPFSLARIVDALNEKLAELTGQPHELPSRHANIKFVDEGRTAYVTVNINRPAAVPTPVR
jgi:hypothetical protein